MLMIIDPSAKSEIPLWPFFTKVDGFQISMMLFGPEDSSGFCASRLSRIGLLTRIRKVLGTRDAQAATVNYQIAFQLLVAWLGS